MNEHEDAPEYAVNPCKVCAPLGASLAFKGVSGTVPILHGSQGCATYIRRYLISHFREPVDIASSSFDEMAAVFGGSDSLTRGLDNVRATYAPEVIGVATTCLSETIGDDVPDILRRYQLANPSDTVMVNVSTPGRLLRHRGQPGLDPRQRRGLPGVRERLPGHHLPGRPALAEANRRLLRGRPLSPAGLLRHPRRRHVERILPAAPRGHQP
jgi:hypothetical protein